MFFPEINKKVIVSQAIIKKMYNMFILPLKGDNTPQKTTAMQT